MQATQALPTRRASWPRWPALALVTATMLVAVTACGFINPNNKPAPLAGYQNGRLPASVLVTVTDTCVAETHAGADLKKLLSKAAHDGIGLRASECYRDYAGQVYWRNYWCSLGRCQMAAVPGTSNHGWGKAVDFDAPDGLGFGSRSYLWLQNNAWMFGWNHPGWAEPGGSAAEPWHWEWVGDGGTMFAQTRAGTTDAPGAPRTSGHDGGASLVDR